MRRLCVLLILLVLAVPQVTPIETANAIRPRAVMLELINAARIEHGARRLGMIGLLADRAARHSRAMIRRDRLFHSVYLYAKVAKWHPRAWGETIGVGPTIGAVFRAWMNSPPHRDILLDDAYGKAGIGIAATRSAWWITTIVFGRR